MTDAFKQQIQAEARQAVEELLEQAKLKKGDVFVVGCSSSEIVGGHIGKDSSLEAAQAVYAGIAPVLAQRGIWLAAQCCEHLNRAIIMEREAAEQYGWEEVCVVPRPHAGGSWATTCWKQCKAPIAVEELRAHPPEAHRRRARKIYRGGLMPYGRKNTGRDAGGRAGHP